MAHYNDHLVDEQHVECAPETPIGSPECSVAAFDSHLQLRQVQGEHYDAQAACRHNALLPDFNAMATQQARRKEASELIQAATGAFLPYSTDQALRAKLTDGTLLCQLANALLGANIDYHTADDMREMCPKALLRQRSNNVMSFLAALEQQLPGLPANCRFTLADLEAAGSDEERPAVTNCLLFIKAHKHQPAMTGCKQLPLTPLATQHSSSHQASQQQRAFMDSPGSAAHQQVQQRLSFGSPGGAAMAQEAATQQHQQQSMAVSSPLRDGHCSLSHSGQQGPHGGFSASCSTSASLVPARTSSNGNNSHAVVARERYGAHISGCQGVQAAAGMTRLMQQCTSMLKERMYVPAEHGGSCGSGGGRHCSPAGPDSAMKVLAPVLEGVLSQLTEEYEKRLLTKDHELSRLCDAKAKLEKQVEGLQTQVQRLQQEAEASSAATAQAAVQAAAEESAADTSALQQQLEEVQERLQQCTQQLAAAQAELAASEKAQAVFNAQVHDLREQLAGLQGVDDKYKLVLRENKALYNTVQDLRGNIRVFCRIRPPGATGDLSPSCVDVGMDGDLAVYDLANGAKKVFKVDRIFDPSTDQAAVYEDTQPLIRSVLDGYNVCIFAYGQTGSGKTHTMSGTYTDDVDGRGINFRALDDLFAIRDSREGEVSYTFMVQMLEIYNETLRDLLLDPRAAAAEGGGSIRPNKLEILATQASGCNVPGATQVEVESAGDVARLMAQGAAQRATSGTKMNDRSSRSHQILTVIVEGLHHVTSERSHACLHLIDLAGSERVGRSEASGERLVEAQHINRSLSALGDVMAALASKDRHVPYRNSKLTQLLQDSLQGQAKVMMFMHVSPEASMFGESISTLKFASRVSEVTLGQAKKNVVSGKVFEAHEEVLKQQRTMESKDLQLQQLVADLEHEQSQRAALQQQVIQLRQQLEAAVLAAAGGASGAAAMPARQQVQLRLPIAEMMAAQAAAVARGSPRTALVAAEAAASSSRRESLCQPLSAGAAATPSTSEQQALQASAAGSGLGSKIPRAQDRTPPRDQDDVCLQPAARRSSLEACPLGQQHCASGSAYDCKAPAEQTPRATPRTSRGNPMRESMSSLKHMERLQSARQSSSFRAVGAASAVSAASDGGGLSVQAFVDAVSGGAGGLRTSKLGGGAGGSSGSSRQSLAGPVGPLASSRSRLDVTGPLTSRVGGVARARLGSEAASSGCMSARQSAVFRTSSNGSSSGGGGAPTSRAGAAAAATSAGAATSRGGSRWK